MDAVANIVSITRHNTSHCAHSSRSINSFAVVADVRSTSSRSQILSAMPWSGHVSLYSCFLPLLPTQTGLATPTDMAGLSK